MGNPIFLNESLSNEEIAKIFNVKTETIKNYFTKGFLDVRLRKDVTKYIYCLENRSGEEILNMLNELYEHIEEFSDLGEARAVLTGVYNLELEEPVVTKEAEKKKPKIRKKDVPKEPYLNEEIGVKEMLKMGFTKGEIVDAFREDSKLEKVGDRKTTRLLLTPYILMEYVTDDEYRRLQLISELYEKDLKGEVEDDEEVEEGIIVAIKFIKEKYNLDLPIPDELEEPEPEAEPEKFQLKDVQEMLGNDIVFDHLLNYLGFKTDDGLVNKNGLEVYAVISDCDDWPLDERQEFLSEIGVEGNIAEIAAKFGKTPYIPKPDEDENDVHEAGPEPETYNIEQVDDSLRYLKPDVFKYFKIMFGPKIESNCFTLNDIAKFGVESKCDDFSLKERDDFLEDFGLEGGVEQVAETFGLIPYVSKEIEIKKPPTKPKAIRTSWLKNPDAKVNVGDWYQAMCKKYGPTLQKEIGKALYGYCKQNSKFEKGETAFMTRKEIYVLLATKFPELEEMKDRHNLKAQF